MLKQQDAKTAKYCFYHECHCAPAFSLKQPFLRILPETSHPKLPNPRVNTPKETRPGAPCVMRAGRQTTGTRILVQVSKLKRRQLNGSWSKMIVLFYTANSRHIF